MSIKLLINTKSHKKMQYINRKAELLFQGIKTNNC